MKEVKVERKEKGIFGADEIFEVREGRKGNWYWVDKSILEHPKLSPTAKLIYSALAYYANNKTQKCYPSYSGIHNLIGVSRRSVATWIKTMEELKVLKINRDKGKINSYTLLDVSLTRPVQNLHQSSSDQCKKDLAPVQSSYYKNNTYKNNTKRVAPANAVAEKLLNGKMETFWQYFLLKTKRGFKLTLLNRNLITERLSSYKLEELKICVDNFVNDEWPGRKDHLDLIYCIGHQKGKPDAVEKWLNKPGNKVVRYV